MKSSTIRRSTLSRESMEVIEALSKEEQYNHEESLGEYVRPNETANANNNDTKAQEIDLLWQNFKTAQFNTKSPAAYIFLGFILGVAVTLIVIFSIQAYNEKNNPNYTGIKNPFNVEKILPAVEQKIEKPEKIKEEKTEVKEDNNQNTGKVSVPTEEETEKLLFKPKKSEKSDKKSNETPKMTKYVVKNGDTGESIIKKHYGSYSPEKQELIMKVNNLQTLDKLYIDQELLIPVE